jgi:hypothetical protein
MLGRLGRAGEGPAEGKPQRRRRFGMGGVRSYMATRIRSLAEATAEQISKCAGLCPKSRLRQTAVRSACML